MQHIYKFLLFSTIFSVNVYAAEQSLDDFAHIQIAESIVEQKIQSLQSQVNEKMSYLDTLNAQKSELPENILDEHDDECECPDAKNYRSLETLIYFVEEETERLLEELETLENNVRYLKALKEKR